MGLLDEAIREHLELKRRRGADAGEISRAESEALGPVRRAPDGTPDLAPDPPAQPRAAYDGDPPGRDPEPDWEDETAARTSDPPPAAYEPPPIPAAPDPGPGYVMPPAAGPGYVMPPAVPPPPTYDEPPPVPAAPAAGPGYVMPPAVPPPPAYDEHPPGFEDLDDDPIEEPPAEPPRGRRSLRLRLRRHSAADEPAPAAPPRPSFEESEPPTTYHEPPPAAYAPPPPPAHQPPPAQDPDSPPAAGDPAGEELLEETPEFLEETPDHDRLWFEQRPPRDFDFDK